MADGQSSGKPESFCSGKESSQDSLADAGSPEAKESTDLYMSAKPSDDFQHNYDTKHSLLHMADAAKYDDSSKMYTCHLCDFRTAFRNSLLNHQAVHSDLRPWVCAVCEYAAKRKQDLKKHLHTIHGLMVDSTMLKPNTSSLQSGNLLRIDEEAPSESSNRKQTLEMDMIYANSHFLPPSATLQHKLSMPCLPHEPGQLVSVKQEWAELTSSRPLPSMSNFVSPDLSDSDADLPLSFPPVYLTKESMINLSRNVPKVPESPFHKSSTFVDKAKFTREGYQTLESSPDDHSSQSSCPSSSKRPRHSYSSNNSLSEMSQDLFVTTQTRPGPATDSDDVLCSSSAGLSQAGGSQTQPSFLCQHCDIMFFQRAMYLMHAGLHSAKNPWCCAVCGSTFTEKYSFTSHFINQHQLVT